MLIITRRSGESVIIDDDIEVTVLAVRGNKIRLGISAPSKVPIIREELTFRETGEQATVAGVS